LPPFERVIVPNAEEDTPSTPCSAPFASSGGQTAAQLPLQFDFRAVSARNTYSVSRFGPAASTFPNPLTLLLVTAVPAPPFELALATAVRELVELVALVPWE
jgi:hypothetical protein